MTLTLPSEMTTIVDVPEPDRLTANFVYNFFEPRERIQGASGGLALFSVGSTEDLLHRAGVLRTREVDGVIITESDPGQLPRYVEIEFTPISSDVSFAVEQNLQIAGEGVDRYENLISTHRDEIQTELGISTGASSAINLQDGPLVENASKYLDLSVSMRADLVGSSADRAKFLNSVTEDSVSGEIILDLINNPDRQDVLFIDRVNNENTSPNSMTMTRRLGIGPLDLVRLQSINLYSQINNRYLASVIGAMAGEPLSPFSDPMSQLLATAGVAGIQSSAREAYTTSSGFSEDEYSAELRVFFEEERRFPPAARIIGYILTKEEVFADGTSRVLEELIIGHRDPQQVNATDSNVKYGSVYRYSLSSVAILQLPAISIGDEVNDEFTVQALVSSRPGASAVVRCVESVPPPSPADFNFTWDYRKRKLVVTWGFPPNPQRDIKRFQVFRRATINEPFELLVEYDFDDSVVPEARAETPKASSVIYLENDNPKTFYIDDGFTKDSSFIYAVCCVDAHDLSSNYSMQFRIRFDRFANVLVKELVSKSGAPKPYPNFYLDNELTLDCMKDSNHYTATVYFDPEYLSIREGDDQVERNLHLLATKQHNRGAYKLQFINVDLQKSKVITIELDDLRQS